MDQKFYAAMAASMSDVMDDGEAWMKNHISGSGPVDYSSFFDGKKIKREGGGHSVFDHSGGGFMDGMDGGGGFGGVAKNFSQDTTVQTRGLEVGTAAQTTGYNAVRLFMSSSVAGAAPTVEGSHLSGSTPANSIDVFTDGTDLFLRRSDGTVKKIRLEGG